MSDLQVDGGSAALPPAAPAWGVPVERVWERSPALAWLLDMPWPAAWYMPDAKPTPTGEAP